MKLTCQNHSKTLEKQESAIFKTYFAVIWKKTLVIYQESRLHALWLLCACPHRVEMPRKTRFGEFLGCGKNKTFRPDYSVLFFLRILFIYMEMDRYQKKSSSHDFEDSPVMTPTPKHNQNFHWDFWVREIRARIIGMVRENWRGANSEM